MYSVNWSFSHCLRVPLFLLEIADINGRECLVAVQLSGCEANAIRGWSHNGTGLLTEMQQEKQEKLMKELIKAVTVHRMLTYIEVLSSTPKYT